MSNISWTKDVGWRVMPLNTTSTINPGYLKLLEDLAELDDYIAGMFGRDSNTLLNLPEGSKRDSHRKDLNWILSKLRYIEKKYDIDPWKKYDESPEE